jgi:hypothetical protein
MINKQLMVSWQWQGKRQIRLGLKDALILLALILTVVAVVRSILQPRLDEVVYNADFSTVSAAEMTEYAAEHESAIHMNVTCTSEGESTTGTALIEVVTHRLPPNGNEFALVYTDVPGMHPPQYDFQTGVLDARETPITYETTTGSVCEFRYR